MRYSYSENSFYTKSWILILDQYGKVLYQKRETKAFPEYFMHSMIQLKNNYNTKHPHESQVDAVVGWNEYQISLTSRLRIKHLICIFARWIDFCMYEKKKSSIHSRYFSA